MCQFLKLASKHGLFFFIFWLLLWNPIIKTFLEFCCWAEALFDYFVSASTTKLTLSSYFNMVSHFVVLAVFVVLFSCLGTTSIISFSLCQFLPPQSVILILFNQFVQGLHWQLHFFICFFYNLVFKGPIYFISDFQYLNTTQFRNWWVVAFCNLFRRILGLWCLDYCLLKLSFVSALLFDLIYEEVVIIEIYFICGVDAVPPFKFYIFFKIVGLLQLLLVSKGVLYIGSILVCNFILLYFLGKLINLGLKSIWNGNFNIFLARCLFDSKPCLFEWACDLGHLEVVFILK